MSFQGRGEHTDCDKGSCRDCKEDNDQLLIVVIGVLSAVLGVLLCSWRFF